MNIIIVGLSPNTGRGIPLLISILDLPTCLPNTSTILSHQHVLLFWVNIPPTCLSNTDFYIMLDYRIIYLYPTSISPQHSDSVKPSNHHLKLFNINSVTNSATYVSCIRYEISHQFPEVSHP